MANDEKWYFTKEQLENTPSKQCGIDLYKELSYRQQAANFIQDMGQRLKVSQLCINTAIVYMHRFYVFHSFSHFPWHSMAAAALFLAAKVEEQPRKLEHVIKIANLCKNPRDTNVDITSERYQAQSQDLVFNENVLLQTLGFDVAIDHPHTHVVRCCHLVRASKDLAQTSYFMASNSLHLTTMCLQYKPTVVACFCIHLACKWSNWEIPLSNEKKEWFSYVDPTVTSELLQQLTDEFLTIFERSPSRLKEKIMAIGDSSAISHNSSRHSNSPFDTEPKKVAQPTDPKDPYYRQYHIENKQAAPDDPHKHRSRPHDSSSSNQQQREREYREKKERERLAQQQQQHGSKSQMGGSNPPIPKFSVPSSHGHHRPVVDPKIKPHSRPPSISAHPPAARAEPRDILREATRDIGLKDFREASNCRDTLREQLRDNSNRDSLSKELSSRDIIKETIKEVSSSGGDRDSLINREMQQVRSSDKEAIKREYMLKTNMTETNSLNNHQDARLSYSADKQRADPSRSTARVVPEANKVSQKHDPVRRGEETKLYLKTENDIKRHLSVSAHDKNSAFVNKPLNSTSQKLKSSFTTESSKSVPKQNAGQTGVIKMEPHNGSSNGTPHGLPLIDVKQEFVQKEEEMLPPPVKKPSLFSPEKSPPSKKADVHITPPNSGKPSVSTSSQLPQLVSPIESPLINSNKRMRTASNSSEPELRPVMTKIDQIEGFENIMRDTSIGIKLHHQIPDMITPITDRKPERIHLQSSIAQELKPPDIIPPFGSTNVTLSQPIVNGIETNPTLISNLLKEAPSVPHLPAVAASAQPSTATVLPEVKEKEREHHHKERKKKHKEKHKHKDKDRSKEEKEKKKKHKDKDREKHKSKEKVEAEPVPTQPIKITIQRDKIQLPDNPAPPRVKLTIPKEKLIKSENLGESSSQATPIGGLKIKIPKEVIKNNYSSESKKRERDRSSSEAPPNKVSKTNYGRSGDSKQNGRSSYSKVSNYSSSSSNNNNVRPQHLNNAVNHMHHSLYSAQNPPAPNYYYYPHGMQVPPPSMPVPNMNVPPPTYMYSDGSQMYSQYYGGAYMYPPEMYQTGSLGGTVPPPLPADAPPDVPPPPPPE